MDDPMSSPLDIDQLQTFIAIVDTGSFTRAADRVFKTLLAEVDGALAVGIVSASSSSPRTAAASA